MSEAILGRIILCAQLMCGGCGNWKDLEARTRSAGAKEAKAQGFVFTRKLGWRCRACIHREQCETCQQDTRQCGDHWTHYREVWGI